MTESTLTSADGAGSGGDPAPVAAACVSGVAGRAPGAGHVGGRARAGRTVRFKWLEG
jgi:hypothetical protein